MNYLNCSWARSVSYRPIGQCLETVGKYSVLLDDSDAASSFEDKTILQKTSYVVRAFLSLPGASLRFLASFDKPYFIVANPVTNVAIGTSADKVRVLTLNAACLPTWITTKYNHLRPTEERAQEIAEEIYKHADEFDVICLQELFDENAYAIIAKKLQEKYPSSVHHVGNNYVGFNSGLCIFSKYPIKDADFHKYSRLVGEDAATNKGFLSVDLAVGERDVRVYTTHTQAGGMPKWLKKPQFFGSTDARRAMQFEPFREHVDQAEKSKKYDAVIVTGDFNLIVTDKTAKEANNPQFFSLFRDYSPAISEYVTGTTYTTEYLEAHKDKKEVLPEHESASITKGRLIDACLVTKNSKVSAVDSKVTRIFTNSSDHLAVETTITFS